MDVPVWNRHEVPIIVWVAVHYQEGMFPATQDQRSTVLHLEHIAEYAAVLFAAADVVHSPGCEKVVHERSFDEGDVILMRV